MGTFSNKGGKLFNRQKGTENGERENKKGGTEKGKANF